MSNVWQQNFLTILSLLELDSEADPSCFCKYQFVNNSCELLFVKHWIFLWIIFWVSLCETFFESQILYFLNVWNFQYFHHASMSNFRTCFFWRRPLILIWFYSGPGPWSWSISGVRNNSKELNFPTSSVLTLYLMTWTLELIKIELDLFYIKYLS